MGRWTGSHTHSLTWRHRELGSLISYPVAVRCSQGRTVSGHVHSQHFRTQWQKERSTANRFIERQTDGWTSNQEKVNRRTSFFISSSSDSWKRETSPDRSVPFHWPMQLQRDCDNICHLSRTSTLSLDGLKDKSCNYPVIRSPLLYPPKYLPTQEY